MIFLLLLIVATVPYLPSIKGEWLFDDQAILDIEFAFRPYLLAGRISPDLPARAKLSTAELMTPNFFRAWVVFWREDRSLTHLVYMWTWQVFGFWRPAWHGLNIAFHVANTFLVYLLASRLFSPSVASIGAIAFAVHPHQVAAVSYISGRAGLQTCFFALCSVLFWFQAVNVWSVIPFWLCVVFSWKSKEDGCLWTLFFLITFAALDFFFGTI